MIRICTFFFQVFQFFSVLKIKTIQFFILLLFNLFELFVNAVEDQLQRTTITRYCQGYNIFNMKTQQFIVRCKEYTIVFFKSGKCQKNGCKQPVVIGNLSYVIKDIKIQSITVTEDIGISINLHKLADKLKNNANFEPEIIPRLRYIKYIPKCVNIFGSGKIVIRGLRQLKYQ